MVPAPLAHVVVVEVEVEEVLLDELLELELVVIVATTGS
jgi:hypothetical protein